MALIGESRHKRDFAERLIRIEQKLLGSLDFDDVDQPARYLENAAKSAIRRTFLQSERASLRQNIGPNRREIPWLSHQTSIKDLNQTVLRPKRVVSILVSSTVILKLRS
jgi:hypothetical protein